MKLEIGMYCYNKTNRKFGVGKIVKFLSNNNVKISYKYDSEFSSKGNVIASFNIIDLIETGDYVNKHLVTDVYLSGERKYIKLDNSYANGEGIRIYEENIKTVVTREQFKNWEYRIGDE